MIGARLGSVGLGWWGRGQALAMVLPAGMDAAAFVAHQVRLLEMEGAAEVAEASLDRGGDGAGDLSGLVERGHAVPRLVVSDVSTGLMGRTLVTLSARLGGDVPAHKLGPGDIVGLRPGKVHGSAKRDEGAAAAGLAATDEGQASSGLVASGLVYRCYADRVVVALDEFPEDDLPAGDASVVLVKLANEASGRRMREALGHALALDGRYAACRAVADVCFGRASVAAVGEAEVEACMARLERDVLGGPGTLGPGLNAQQRAAVGFCMASRDVAVVHGPPGTGKTTTVCELLRVAAASGLRVLATAPSNVAVDNMVERVAGLKGVRAVRLGHPARLLPSVLSVSLDALVAGSDSAALAKDIVQDMAGVSKQLAEWGDKRKRKGKRSEDSKRAGTGPGQAPAATRGALRAEMRGLRKELRERERRAVHEILGRCNVVFATCTGAGARSLGRWMEESREVFDLVVVDEAAMALEAATWIPLVLGRRCVLAGDHCQLPPVVKSDRAAREGLAVTLFERLALGDSSAKACSFMLETQYRMHADICAWPSRELYSGRLVADASVADHVLRGLPGVRDCDFTGTPLVLVDTDGCEGCEEAGGAGESKRNEGEARTVERLVRACLTPVADGGLGLDARDVGIITPYNAQVDVLRELLRDGGGLTAGLEIGSVDGFQGREKELIVLSLVRSNDKGRAAQVGKKQEDNGIGFLAEDRRINVAVTRARRCCAVVCDSQTVGRHAFLNRMVEHFNAKGEYHSADEFLGDDADAAALLGVLTDRLEAGAVADEEDAVGGAGAAEEARTTPDTTGTNPPAEEHQLRPAAGPVVAAASGSGSTPVPGDGVRQASAKEAKPKRPSLTKEDVKAKVEAFLAKAEGKAELGFSPNLNTYERMLVHDVCEELGVAHVSRGKDKQRRVFVLYGVPPAAKPDVDDAAVAKAEAQAPGKGVAGAEDAAPRGARGDPRTMAALAAERRLAAMQGTPLDHVTPPPVAPRMDISAVLGVEDGTEVGEESQEDGDEGGGEPLGEEARTSGPRTQRPRKGKKKKANKKGGGNAGSDRTPALPEVDDIDALLDELAVGNKYCSFKVSHGTTTCGRPTGMIGATCAVCRLRFCLEHGVPESHGCGDGIRRLERERHLHSHAVHAGASNLKPSQRKSLMGQLKAKVAGLVSGRSKARDEDADGAAQGNGRPAGRNR